MAVDHAIAEACAAGKSPPTLRFYRWHPPAISLGRHQTATDIDLIRADELGYDIVRRTTGGRAILHVDELTYSIAASRDEPRVSGGVMDAYLRLSNGLQRGLMELGVQADKAGADVRTGKDVSAACFEVPSAYEITVRGRKLIGSAQSRRRNFVLQHGSLPLTGDITRLIQVLNVRSAERQRLIDQLNNRACTLEWALTQRGVPARDLPNRLQFEQIAKRLSTGFAGALTLSFPSGLTAPAPSNHELARAAQLIREQYGNLSWTFSK